MQWKTSTKLLISIPLLILLIALDGVSALEGMPMLAITLGLALLAGDAARNWLRARGRVNLAWLPFMAAALVLLIAFCKGRDLSQGALFLITLGVVFDILLIALAAIAEAGKRQVKGLVEFAGLLVAGMAMGFVLSLMFAFAHGGPAATSLARP